MENERDAGKGVGELTDKRVNTVRDQLGIDMYQSSKRAGIQRRDRAQWGGDDTREEGTGESMSVVSNASSYGVKKSSVNWIRSSKSLQALEIQGKGLTGES